MTNQLRVWLACPDGWPELETGATCLRFAPPAARGMIGVHGPVNLNSCVGSVASHPEKPAEPAALHRSLAERALTFESLGSRPSFVKLANSE